MNVRAGVDLIEIERLSQAVARHGERFLGRVYTGAELVACGGRVESLAGRFAAKEAVAKALGVGIGVVAWKEIEVLGDEHSAPSLRLHGAAQDVAERLGLAGWSLSISHSRREAVCVVVAIGKPDLP